MSNDNGKPENPAAARPYYTDDQVRRVLDVTHGNLIAAASLLGVNRGSLRVRLTRDRALGDYARELRSEYLETQLDAAEIAVEREIAAGNLQIAWAFLRARGGHRGWTGKTEIIVAAGIESTVQVVDNTANTERLAELKAERNRLLAKYEPASLSKPPKA